MTAFLDSIRDIAGSYDGIVLDQWGVLHDGASPYPGAEAAVAGLSDLDVAVAVLSNSGKRAAPNAARIAGMGFNAAHFDLVMTSGEALWREIASGAVAARAFFAIERQAGDATAWASGLDIALTPDMAAAEAVLLMGLPDGAAATAFDEVLAEAQTRQLPIYCSNPDRKSPRGEAFVLSPGELAHRYAAAGGAVRFYGKPHRPVFDAVKAALGETRLLMVGDSLEHDIAGGHAAGWDTLLIRGGIHRADLAGGAAALAELAATYGATPTYTLEDLR